MRRLLLTRPRAQAADWAQRLAALGAEVESLPLIEIEAATPTARDAAWARLQHGAALAVFVSPNAVRHTFAGREPGAWPVGLRAACVGPGTAQALLDAGLAPDQVLTPDADAAHLDSEHLWPQLASEAWAGRRVVFLRGDGGREWLADHLRAAGAQVEAHAVYHRSSPVHSAAERALLARVRAAPAQWAWLFTSSESLTHLQGLLPAAERGTQVALATHPRIADACRTAGFSNVVLTRPSAESIVQALTQSPPL